ncbi:MAG: adenylate kinase [Candidatus Omnitrophica bacterium]|nr:adenylate kinase [Candidatus Omnitrophota bacterium]MCB9747667.1 adenylate kinase [Candidatus Omnitrophota bacterium]
MKIVLLGPPGAGKGTLAGLLKSSLGVFHVSTGDILREEMKADSPLGQETKNYVEKGQLVPDELVTRLVKNKLSDHQLLDKGYLLDGFPRTKAQAEELDKILAEINQPIDFALYMEATLPMILRRLTGRRVCKNCGAVFHLTNRPSKKEGICDVCNGALYQRSDDNEETIRNRMDVYLKNTKPIVDYYETQGKLKKVDGDKESEELQESLMQILDETESNNHH